MSKEVYTLKNHRIVMAFSIFALGNQDGAIIEDISVVSKSYPKFFKDLLDRKGIPHIFADALEGFDDEDFKSLSDRDIRLQGLHELISIPFTAFQINRTEVV